MKLNSALKGYDRDCFEYELKRHRVFGIGRIGLLIAVIAVLVIMVVSCRHADTEVETNEPVSTEGDTGETETSSDNNIPKTDTFITTTNLVIPGYDMSAGGIVPSNRDIWSDTWVATDGADRQTADASDTRNPNNRLVGLFYFLWRDADQNVLSNISPSDHYAAYIEGGVDKLWEVMQEGGEGHPHYWAEPYFGYYSSNDEWVLRRHAYMFADAGIDFVFFDTTNNNLHTVSHQALLKVWDEVRKEGYNVPKICFLCGGNAEQINELYESIYAQEAYKELWFYWNDKPLLMLTGDANITEEQKNFFTIRYSWAVGATPWYDQRRGRACWPWSSKWPQAKGFSETGELEQMVVMCGSGAMNGRSERKGRRPQYSGNWDFGYSVMDTATPFGYTFEDQFNNMMKSDPPLIMITGWNEWIAGRWSGAGAGAGGVGMIVAGEYVVSSNPNDKQSSYYVDQFNPEYSRDIEPMKNGFEDNYYYQMAEYNRIYKGSRAVESAFGQWAIDINGSVGQWYAIGPEYRDYEGDITYRCSPGHVGGNENGMYVNFSGRNDIVMAKVSNDSKYLYFYVECADDITAPEGVNWMNLFLNSDCNDSTGWYGYDFILNRTQNDRYVSVDKFVGTDEWSFERVGQAEYSLNGRVLQIKIEKSLIGFVDTIDFKWADNSVPTGNIMEFLDQGDAAPNHRYNYRFTLLETSAKIPEELENNITVLKSRSYNSYIDGKCVRIVDDNTNGVLFASGLDIWLPVSFLEKKLGISCLGAESVNHYGIDYVKANEYIEKAGKLITVTDYGLVVITDKSDNISLDDKTLRVLYRALN